MRERRKQEQAVKEVVDFTFGKGPRPTTPLPATLDLATVLRNRYLEIVGQMSDEDLLNKDFASAVSLGLKAQGQIDAREKAKAKQGTAEQAFAIIAMLRGDLPPKMLDDGLTVEGAFEEIATDDDE
ncbi:MAG: hypothetical protein EXR69_12535 [Myxococcales bacterium]|nr:hypothetical protein [Myxococcales bacterium]